MKTKSIILLAVSAIVTLSFTLVSVRNSESKLEPAAVTKSASVQNEPIGGFVSEDKF
jgi:hypothetical protein